MNFYILCEKLRLKERRLLQPFTEIIETNAKNGVVIEATRIENSFKRAYGEVEDNIIIYIYIYIRLRILGLMSHVTIITRMAA